MPLDGQEYLIRQGWSGQGTGLRDGAITRPLAIPQKKNLAGLGKDRDEAFPFWDHLFTAAAKSIQLKCLSDSDDGNSIEEQSCSQGAIRRTTTGILSNRRPVEGTSAHPSMHSYPGKQRVNLIATAKQDAAKQSLYSRFFRGPVLGPDEDLVSKTTRVEDYLDTFLDMSGSTRIESEADINVGRSAKRKRDLEGKNGSLLKKRRVKESEGEKRRSKEKKRKKKGKNVLEFEAER